MATAQLVLTAILAGIASFIAWRQAETARAKLKLDLFERRFRVYRGLMDFLGEVTRSSNFPDESLHEYYASTNEKRFLFDTDITIYMREVRELAIDLRVAQNTINQLRDDPGREDEHHKAVERSGELLKWFAGQTEQAQHKFMRYLSFRRSL